MNNIASAEVDIPESKNASNTEGGGEENEDDDASEEDGPAQQLSEFLQNQFLPLITLGLLCIFVYMVFLRPQRRDPRKPERYIEV